MGTLFLLFIVLYVQHLAPQEQEQKKHAHQIRPRPLPSSGVFLDFWYFTLHCHCQMVILRTITIMFEETDFAMF